MCPLAVRPHTAFVAVPILAGVSVLSYLLVRLGSGFSRLDGVISLLAFAMLLPIFCGRNQETPSIEADTQPVPSRLAHPGWAVFGGLVLLVAASHLLVWGAVDLARTLGVSELLIGLTIVAAGTSLPELASAIASARRKQPDFVLGNIIGSNFFNTLVVVGTSGTIRPFTSSAPNLLSRDLPTMLALTLAIGLLGLNWKRPRKAGLLSRLDGLLILMGFAGYLIITLYQEVPAG